MEILFSRHAKQRIVEFGLTKSEAIKLIEGAHPDKSDKQNRKYKQEKYGDVDVMSLRNGSYLFTVTGVINKFTGNTALLVITLVDQMINLKKYTW